MRKYTTRTPPGDVLTRVLRSETALLTLAIASAASCASCSGGTARQKAAAVGTTDRTEARQLADGGFADGGFADGGASSHATAWPASWQFPRGTKDSESRRGTIVTDAAIATRIGADVLASGGNAVDAAVAAAFALAVAYPTAGNIGGGGFLVARSAGVSYALDFRETAPAAATRDMYLGSDGKTTANARDGWLSVGVPGSVAGLWEGWSRLGSKRKTWAELLAPAIALADQGFVVDAAFVTTITRVQARLARFPASAALFLPNGAPPPVGSTWRNPDLAKVLRRVAAQGPPGFYEGEVADTLVHRMTEGGGLVTADDLKRYRAKWRTPIEFEYRGRRVVGMPPPSSGAVTIELIAHLLSNWDLGALGWHSAEHIHVVAEAMRRAFAARNARLGDPDFVNNPLDELLSPNWAKKQAATMRLDRATPTSELFPHPNPVPPEGTHTTHLAAVDEAGNAVVLTTTVNDWYGSAVTVPGLGFVLNDEMDDFATVPGTPNIFGLVQGEPNAIAPGKRMLSSMSPTIVLDAAGQPAVLLGAAGGSLIITAVFEELSNIVDFGFLPGDAVRAPRFHQQDLPDVLFFERHGLDDGVVQALEAMGHVTHYSEHNSDAPAIGRVGGAWQGAAEPRREGSLSLGLGL
jgi:gamma-glutamyltranspeptidase/glutathione hydrolase